MRRAGSIDVLLVVAFWALMMCGVVWVLRVLKIGG